MDQFGVLAGKYKTLSRKSRLEKNNIDFSELILLKLLDSK